MTEINISVSKKYDVFSNIYDWFFKYYTRKTIAKAIQFAPLKGKEKICDIGCGTGALEQALLHLYPSLNISACDVSFGMMAKAIKKLHGFPQVTFYSGDFLQTPLEENGYDIVFTLSNLQYFFKPEAIFQKAFRLARPGGYLVLLDWTRLRLRSKIYEEIKGFLDKGFHKFYSITDTEILLKKTGWIPEAHENFSVQWFWNLMVLRARKPL